MVRFVLASIAACFLICAGSHVQLADAQSQVTRITYTPTGRPEVYIDPEGNFTNFDYDVSERLVFEVDPSGQKTQYHYNGASNIVAATHGLQSPGKAIKRFERQYVLPGVTGRLRQAKGLAGNPGVSATSSRYDTLYQFDGFQRLNKVTFPDGSYESYQHDENGNIVSFRKRSGAVINAGYDDLNRLQARTTPEFSYAFGYDALNRLTRETVSDRSADYAFSASHNYTYDYAGRAKQISFNLSYDGHQITKHLHFMYGSDQQTTTIGISDTTSYSASGLFIHNTMDELGRLADIDYFAAGGRLGTRIASYQYDRHGRPSRLAYPGSSVSWEYEIDNDLRSETHFFNGDNATPQVRFDYGYDKASRLKTTNVSVPNWLWSPQADRITHYDEANALDQIPGYTRVGEDKTGASAEIQTFSLGYDGSGNLSSQTNTETGTTRTLTYDADNRLLMIEEAPGLKVRYLYDARGRRVVKHVLEGSKQGITFYLHYGDQEIAEMDENGNILVYYIPGAGVDQRTAMIKNTGTCRDNFINNEADCFYYYHANRLGNVISVAHQGRVEDKYIYSPFGIEEPLNASGNPFRYTGQRYDAESGLYYYKARYYDPVLGRFLQTDPIGYADQWNLYAYVHNDPVNAIDPNGEDSISVQFKDQKINWRAGIVIPQTVSGGHSGSVIVSNSGRTEYREYGRYGEQFDGDARGSVQTADVADLVFEGGVPTSDSLTGLFEDLLSHGAESGSSDLNLEFNLAADDFDGMLSEADRWDQDVTYSIAGKTCHDFCRAVTRAGGGRTGGQHSRNPDRNRFEQSLTPDNIDQAVENVRRQYEDRQ